jgi:hypothetical protein
VHAESVAVESPVDEPQEVHQANAVSSWTVVPQDPAPALPIDPAAAGSVHDLQPPQNLDPSYLKDLLTAIQSQSVNGNPALQSLA